MLSTFDTAGAHVLATQIPVRYAVRQVLDQELQKTIALHEATARQARFKAGGTNDHELLEQYIFSDDKENAGQKKLPSVPTMIVKKDFFGRVIAAMPLHDTDGNGDQRQRQAIEAEQNVWVTYHEGLNNAVRKPLTLEEFLRGL